MKTFKNLISDMTQEELIRDLAKKIKAALIYGFTDPDDPDDMDINYAQVAKVIGTTIDFAEETFEKLCDEMMESEYIVSLQELKTSQIMGILEYCYLGARAFGFLETNIGDFEEPFKINDFDGAVKFLEQVGIDVEDAFEVSIDELRELHAKSGYNFKFLYDYDIYTTIFVTTTAGLPINFIFEDNFYDASIEFCLVN